MTIIRILIFLLGFSLVAVTLFSATRTFVLPRSANDPLTRVVFVTIWRVFRLRLRWVRDYAELDRIVALYAPISLLSLPSVWLALVLVGYTGMFWASGVPTWREAFLLSGSSLLTLGFASAGTLAQTALVYSEAVIGLTLVALLIAYLPTMYSAFSRRELAVNLLEIRAGSPPSAVELILRFHRLKRFDHLHEFWETWETWFADIEESHTSLAALVFFRSPRPAHSWVTASGAVLDSAALAASTLDLPRDAQMDLCLRAGYLALRHIADFFRIPYNREPHYPADPISVTREEFDAACDRMAQSGVPLKPDRDQCWRDFAGWRVNYDAVLLALCGLTLAPYAPWSSDRAPRELRIGYSGEIEKPK